MAGICGWLRWGPGPGPGDHLLGDMMDLLSHRGDQGRMTSQGEGWALGVVGGDERGRRHPAGGPEGPHLAVVDGFLSVSSEAVQRLHLRSGTPCDGVLLAAYRVGLASSLANLIGGSFAGAVLDLERRRLVLIRDHLGSKPLFYYAASDGLFFASEIKPLLRAGASKEMDLRALDLNLTFGSVPGHLTMFSAIQRLMPGHMVAASANSLSVEPYWDIHYRPEWEEPETEIKSRVHDLLRASVAEYLPAHGDLAATLSGGIDSSSVVGLIRSVTDRPLHTFFVGFQATSELKDERFYARLVSKHYGTHHHEFYLQPQDVLPDLMKVAWHAEQPFIDFSEFFLSRFVSEHSKVLLTGEAADSLFAGTSNFAYLAGRLEPYARLPQFVRSALGNIVPHLPRVKILKKNPVYALQTLVKAERSDPATRCHALLHVMNEEQKVALFGGKKSGTTPQPSEFLHQVYFAQAEVQGVVEETLWMMQKRLVPDQFLEERLKSAWGVEFRSPFTNRSLVDYISRIPWRLKYRHPHQKYILVEAVKHYLPEEVLNRPKQGFSLPMRAWLNNELKPAVAHFLSETTVRRRGLLHWPAVKTILEQFFAGSRFVTPDAIWLLIMLEVWHQVFVDQDPTVGIPEMNLQNLS